MVAQAVILCGGLGSRLGALTDMTPKPLLDVGGRPFLDHLVQEVARHGVARITLLAGHLGEQIRAALHRKRLFGAEIEVLVEPAPFGTGGALGFAAAHLDPEFLLLNGDSWIDADLTRFVRSWRQARLKDPALIVQMLLHRVADSARFGRATLEGDRVASFDEKDAGHMAAPGWINAGVYVVDRRIVDLIAPHTACSLERDILPRLVAERRVAAVQTREGAYFVDIGLPDTLARVQQELIAARTRPAVFFDRDGTLTQPNGDPSHAEQLAWRPQAREAIALANDRRYFVFVVRSPAGIADESGEKAVAETLHRAMQESLAQVGAHVDAFEGCLGPGKAAVSARGEDRSRQRSGTGPIPRLLSAWPVEPRRSFLISSGRSCIEAAHLAGLRAVRYESGSILDTLSASF